jgi:hypothetical protein
MGSQIPAFAVAHALCLRKRKGQACTLGRLQVRGHPLSPAFAHRNGLVSREATPDTQFYPSVLVDSQISVVLIAQTLLCLEEKEKTQA